MSRKIEKTILEMTDSEIITKINTHKEQLKTSLNNLEFEYAYEIRNEIREMEQLLIKRKKIRREKVYL